MIKLKDMQNMTGLLPGGMGKAGIIDFKNVIIPENDKIWVAQNVWDL